MSSSRRKPGSRGLYWAPVFTGVTAFFVLVLSAPLHAEILTIFSDKGFMGVPPNSVPTYGSCNFGAGNGGYNGGAPEGNPPEGFASWKTTETIPSPNVNPVSCPGGFDNYLGFGLQNAVPQDLHRFEAGELRFWINASKGDILIEIKDQNGTATFSKRLDTLGWNIATDANQWRYFHIPFSGNLTGTRLSAVSNPILFTALSTPTQFYVDHVRYVDTTVQQIFNVTVKNILDDQPVTSISWVNPTAAAHWVRAAQYVQLDVDMPVSPWGIQIYTDNTNGTGTAQFRGDPTSVNPAGLVDTGSQAGTLPLAWSIKAQTFAPQSAEPNDNFLIFGVPKDPNASQWLYMKDAQTKDIPNTSTVFKNGDQDPFIVVKNNLGIHFGQGNTLDSSDFGAENSPNYIYLESNFSAALVNRTFTTSKIVVELFTP